MGRPRGLLQRAEKRLGRVADNVLAALGRARTSEGAPDTADPRSILCIRIDRIGDLLVSTPLFAAARERWPRAEQYALCSPQNAVVAHGNRSSLDGVMVFPRRNVLALTGLLWRLRRARFDWIVELNEAWSRTGAMLAMAAGGSRTFAASLPQYVPRKRGYAGRILELDGRVHQAELVKAWGRILGCPVACAVPRFEVGGPARTSAAEALRALGIAPKGHRTRPMVAVNLGNQKKAGRDTYSLENARRLVQGLADAVQVVILQGAHPAEAEAARALANSVGGLLAPLLPLDSLAGFVSEMDALVSPCTGILHLAQAVRTPSVALCRQFNYDVWRPLEPPHRSLVGAPGDAIDEIAPERVADAVISLLRNARLSERERKDRSPMAAGGLGGG